MSKRKFDEKHHRKMLDSFATMIVSPKSGVPQEYVELCALNVEVDLKRAEIAKKINVWLKTLEGKNFGRFVIHQTFVNVITLVVDKIHAVFECPKCGEPARLKCVQTGGMETGVFSFTHGSKSTHSGGSTIPKLEIYILESGDIPYPPLT